MTVTLDIDKMFDQFVAEADLRASHQQSGRHFKGSEAEIRRAFGKICAPLQALLEDAAEARDVLKSHGYGTDDMPLALMVNDLLARLVEAAGPESGPEIVENPEIGLDLVDPNHALDVIMGRIHLEGPKSTLQDALSTFGGSDISELAPRAAAELQRCVVEDFDDETKRQLLLGGMITDVVTHKSADE